MLDTDGSQDATNQNSLYDSYIRAFRWAPNRIGEQGLVCYVTNAGWLDGNTMDGLRKCFQKEFSNIYVYNLHGNQRTKGEESRPEGGKIFGSGSRTPVAITILVKAPAHDSPARIHYHDIGDYLSEGENKALIAGAGDINGIEWDDIKPNADNDWINQRRLRHADANCGRWEHLRNLSTRCRDEPRCLGLQLRQGRTAGSVATHGRCLQHRDETSCAIGGSRKWKCGGSSRSALQP